MGNLVIYGLIVFAGVLQAFGNPMNSQLKDSLQNPWLAATVSFALIVPIFILLFSVQPRPLPTAEGISGMPWWAPLGGVVGAVAVAVGLVFVSEIGAGALGGLLITANLLTSLAVDHFGWFHLKEHAASPMRLVGAALMVGGITLISKF